MGAGADEVEAGNVFALVVEAEPGGLRENGRDGEAGAVRGEEGVAEVGRGDVELGDEVLVEIGEDGFLQLVEDALGVAGPLVVPIDGVLKIGDWGEDVEGVLSVGCHGRIGGGGTVEVETEVVGDDAALEDVIEESAVAGAEEDGVVGDVFVAAVGGEKEDEEAHGVFAGGEFSIGPLAAVDGGDELAVDGGWVGVGHDEVGFDLFAPGEADAGGMPVANEDFFDGGAMAELHAVALAEGEEGVDEGTGAAAGEPDAPLAFEVVDEGVKTRGVERVAADEEGLDAEEHAQGRIAQVTADEIVNGAVATQANEIRQDADHVRESAEGFGGEFGKACVVEFTGFFEKAEVSALVERIEFGDFAQGVFDGAAVVEGAALVVDHAIPRFDREEFDVVGAIFTEEGEEFVEQERGGQDRGARVIEKSVAAEDAGASAVVGLAFEQGDFFAEGAEAEGGGESAEAGADDESAGGGWRGGHRPPLQVVGFVVRWKMAGSRMPAARVARCGAKGAGSVAEAEVISSQRRWRCSCAAATAPEVKSRWSHASSWGLSARADGLRRKARRAALSSGWRAR